MKKNYIQKGVVSLLLVITLLLPSGCSLPQFTDQNGTDTTIKEYQAERDQKQAKQEQQRFQKWCDAQFLDTLKQSGTLNLHYTIDDLSKYGITENKDDITFGDLSLESAREDAKEVKKCYKELKAFDYDSLTKDQQDTYDILDYYLKLNCDFEGYELYGQYLSPDLGLPANIPVELAEYPLRSVENVDTYLILLSKLPEYFAQLAQYEKEVAEEGLFISDDTLNETVKQMEDFVKDPENNYLITTFAARLDAIDGLGSAEKEKYIAANKDAVNTYIISAYKTLIKQLQKLKGKGTNEGGLCGYKKGKEYYSLLTRSNTCSNMKVTQVEKMVKNRLKILMKRLQKLVAKNPDIFDQYETSTCKWKDPDQILTYLKKEIGDYFPECPDVTYQVKYVDASLAEYLSPAFYMVPQIDNYKNNTIYINNKSSSYSEDSLYQTLAHEGFPGHLYQTTYYNETNPEPLRQILNFGGYSEGWATYVELSSFELYDYGEEDADITDLNQIETELSLALSTLADIGVNYHGWNKKRLRQFLDDYNMGTADVVNDLYQLVINDPANYQQYYVSYLEIWQLRCKAKSEAKHFNIKDFHKVILESGPSPFPYLEQKVEAYIAATN